MSRFVPCAVALLLTTGLAGATTVRRQSLETLTDSSDQVVHGHVERVELRDDTAGPPFTLAYVRVSERAKGQGDDLVPVRIPGGMTKEGLICGVAGVPQFAEGDDVVLFLASVPDTATASPTIAPAVGNRPHGRGVPAGGAQPRKQWQPVGLALGAWRVSGQGDDAVAVHDPASGGLAVVGDAAGSELPARAKVKDLMARVRARGSAK